MKQKLFEALNGKDGGIKIIYYLEKPIISKE